MLKPLLPFVNDWWQHEFNETEHVSLIHAKYGSHHLQAELAETNSNSKQDQCNLKIQDQVFIGKISPPPKFHYYS